MNKDSDERLVPAGEYVDAMNVRVGATELSEAGALENSKGNVRLTTLKYNGASLSASAVCIGALDDGVEETMYWFVHDPANTQATGGVVDMIVSFETKAQLLTYHVITASLSPTETSLLNFNPTYLVNGVNKIDDLLFFTDNYNAPRKINVTRAYPAPVAHADQIVELDISVIKPPPLVSPTISLQANQANDNFMEDTFMCFATRYKYKDGEYSATSQFSDPAFIPSDYSLERRSYMNAGMENAINNASVTFNTGVSNVVAIDVLFKEADSNVIYVAKKLDKTILAYQDNSDQTLSFSNGDIYTILNNTETLRLYDNVPLLSKAQTIMGNRLMYGNNLEGRDLIDKDGVDVKIEYIAEPISQSVSSVEKQEDTTCGGCTANIDYLFTGSSTIRTNEILVDLVDIPVSQLIDGAQISIEVTFFNPGVLLAPNTGPLDLLPDYYPYPGVFPDEVQSSQISRQTIEFGYVIQGNHTSLDSAFNGSSWFSQIGSLNGGNYQENPNNWSSGYTMTDNYNASVASPVPRTSATSDLVPIRSAWETPGVNGTDPFRMFVYGGDLHVSLNGINYVDDVGNDNYYVIPQIEKVRVTFQTTDNQKSLHSNRDYQVGIVYQDKEGRQTTALESIANSFHISAYDSESLNTAKINIPYTMHPPKWADKYKFVMKQTETDYDTIFATQFFKEAVSEKAWIRIQGENSDKVYVGQELRVKLDSAGATSSNITTTVLEIKTVEKGFFQGDSSAIPPIPDSPAGTYFQVLPDNFTLDYDAVGTVLTGGKITKKTGAGSHANFPGRLDYPCYTEDDTGAATPWYIPAGSLVVVNIMLHRREYDKMSFNHCGRETCKFEFEGVATMDYDNIHDFWLGEGVDIVGQSDCGPWGYDDTSGANSQAFSSDLFNLDFGQTGTSHITASPVENRNKYQFTHYLAHATLEGRFFLEIQSGTKQCPSVAPRLRKESKIECEIVVYSTAAQIVFETIPTVSISEIYYENSESFDIVNGFHLSGSHVGDVNQTASVAGVVNLGFFNCYSFFNGIESYKIRDSVIGKKFYLGNRVTAVSDQDYKQIRRESTISYSGVYNEQNNVNRLNEFNLGLANYKDLESSYGPIQVLHSRRKSVLVLQEDKISYVGQGQNVLSDAAGGGILTSVPEILGTQVPRIEEYGISENPESFAHYGTDIYFTDAKRSSVIQLKGGEQGDAMKVASSIGMRTWFRGLFESSFDRQKLGGYDPFMNEYVLSPNTNKLPFEVPVYECGGSERIFTGIQDDQVFTIDFGNTFGDVTISGNTDLSSTITATYNGIVYPLVPVATTGAFSFVFDKNNPAITQATIRITPNAISTGSSTVIDPINCPQADYIRIIPIVLTSIGDVGETRHQEFLFQDTSTGYFSPIQSQQDQFIASWEQQYTSATLVTRYGPAYSGYQGSGTIPMDGATVYIQSRRIAPSDTYVYNTSSNKMRWLRTSLLYNNNAAEIASLVAASTAVINGGSEPLIGGNFPMPTGSPNDYLYMIWDYREIAALKLCYSTSTPTISEACCDCFSAPNCIPFLGSAGSSASSVAACALASDTTTYYTSAITTAGVTNTQPVLGATVYSADGCVPWGEQRRFLAAGFIKINDGLNSWVEIDADNIVIAVGTC